MNKNELIKILISYAAKAFKCSEDTLDENTVFDELGTNSMKRITMCALIENNLDVVIPVVEFGKYETIGMLADKIISEME